MMLRDIISEKMVFGGNCIGKIDGKTIFIPYAIPGEKLQIEITETHRDYDRARIVDIIEASPHRIQPICPLYGICGGCNMMHIDNEYQRVLRSEILEDCFKREGITPPEIIPVYGYPFGYRSRFQLRDGGFSKRGTNTVIEPTHCPIAAEAINNYFATVSPNCRPRGRVHVFGGDCVIPQQGQEKTVIAKEKPKEQHQPEHKGGRKAKPRYAGSIPEESNKVTVTVLGHTISFDVLGFFQSNIEMLEKTIKLVCTDLHGKNVLDMYCGAGTFSVFLSDLFSTVTLVEHNRDALVFAEQNIPGKNHESYGISGEKWVVNNAPGILAHNGAYDAVVIDPPRSGMEKAVCDWLCNEKTGKLRSLSCDPATHARDAAKLVKSGYRLTKLYMLDFYPQTCDIESLADFEQF